MYSMNNGSNTKKKRPLYLGVGQPIIEVDQGEVSESKLLAAIGSTITSQSTYETQVLQDASFS